MTSGPPSILKTEEKERENWCLSKLGIERYYLNIIKALFEKSIANTYSMAKD